MPLPIQRPFYDRTHDIYMADIGAAASAFKAIVGRGKLVPARVTIQAALTGADSVVTVKKNGTAVPGFTITAAFSGSAAGSVFQGAPTALTLVDAGDVVEFASDGGATNVVPAWITLIVRETSA